MTTNDKLGGIGKEAFETYFAVLSQNFPGYSKHHHKHVTGLPATDPRIEACTIRISKRYDYPMAMFGVSVRYRLDDLGSIPGTASRPALGPIQPPIQWLPGDLSPEVKQQERESAH
jgi:hypothetical protein